MCPITLGVVSAAVCCWRAGRVLSLTARQALNERKEQDEEDMEVYDCVNFNDRPAYEYSGNVTCDGINSFLWQYEH